jgi:cyclophilin family peptidyl-prolyl cis-trans isomerase/HEAT repeat protein
MSVVRPALRTDPSNQEASGPEASCQKASCAPRARGGARGLRLVLVLAAAVAGGGAAPADLPVMRPPDLELRAMLLLVAERRLYEPLTVQEALKAGPELRAELAAALGRIPGPDAGSVLAGLLIDDQAEVRRAAAFGLGLHGDAAARPALRKAMLDPDRETGALAVEALGRLGTPLVEVAEQLLQLPEEERWPRLLPYLFRFKEAALVPLAEHGLGLPDPELHRWSAYALARDPLPAALPLLRRLAGDPDPLVRAWAARGLGRVGTGKEDLAALAPLLGEPATGPVVEALRAGAALVGGGKAEAAATWRPRLLALLADPRAGVRVTAIEAAGAWLPDSGLGAALAERAGAPPAAPPKGGTGSAAPAASSQAGAAVGAAKAQAAETAAALASPVPLAQTIERGTALVALARGHDLRAEALVAAAAGSQEPRLRARAAEAAGLLGGGELLGRLAADPNPLVREAALTARLRPAPAPAPSPVLSSTGAAAGAAAPAGQAGAAGPGKAGSEGAAGKAGAPAAAGGRDAEGTAGKAGAARENGASISTDTASRAAAAALSDPDEGVRTTAVDWLADHPVVPLANLAGALTAALRDESIESPLGVIKALAARGEAEPRERGAAVELLERMGRQPSYALRREAAAGLTRLGRPAPSLDPARAAAGGGDELRFYREIVERTRRQPIVEVRTNRGAFRLRLDCPRAPRTCLNFLDLAGQHFYDGLLFHRVVPDFVVQAGDPRGDGYGGPGYVIGDEINRLRYRRGIVGMALAGPDTGGSQFFITLSPQPHLDGGYTAFGEVVAGAEVLDSIQAGDRIESIVEMR